MNHITKPMLAGKCERPDALSFPVLATPKLDGIRCLKINGRALTRSFKPVPAHNQAAALAHGDWPAPALLLDDGGKKLNLVRAVPVRIDRVRLECRRIDEGIVGAVDLHARWALSNLPPHPHYA